MKNNITSKVFVLDYLQRSLYDLQFNDTWSALMLIKALTRDRNIS
jgi:hypothetical protein